VRSLFYVWRLGVDFLPLDKLDKSPPSRQREHPMVFFSMPWFLNHGYQQNPANSAGRKLSSSRFLRRNQWHNRGLQQHTQKSIATSIDTTKNRYGWYTQDFAWQKSSTLSTWPLRPVGSHPHRHPHRSPPDLAKWHPAKAVTIQWNA